MASRTTRPVPQIVAEPKRPVELVPGEAVEALVRRAPVAPREPVTTTARLRAENRALRERVGQMERLVQILICAERADADRRVAAVLDGWRQEKEAKRTKDRDRKNGLPATTARSAKKWNEEQFQTVVLPYEIACQATAHRRSVDTNALTGKERHAACMKVARLTRLSYASVRSILRKAATAGDTFMRQPPSEHGYSGD